MAFLGGRTKLFPDLAWSAVENGIANGLGVDTLTAAAGIIEVVNNNMVNAIRAVSLERGIDPRPYTLLAGGGAAGLHIGRLLAQLKMKRAFVPTEASTLSAFGMTATDITHDYSAPLFGVSREVDVTLVTALFKDLEDSAVEDLRAAGMEGERVALSRYVDARYAGQVHELLTPVPEGPVTASALEDLRREFNEIHTERYGYGMSARDVELLSWRVTARGLLDKRNEDRFSVAVATRCDAVAETTRSAYFAECGGFVDVPVYLSSAFSPGGTVVGPGLIESSTTTVVVYPGQTAVSDGRGNLLLEL
jgi:N-methylhydantoinase A